MAISPLAYLYPFRLLLHKQVAYQELNKYPLWRGTERNRISSHWEYILPLGVFIWECYPISAICPLPAGPRGVDALSCPEMPGAPWPWTTGCPMVPQPGLQSCLAKMAHMSVSLSVPLCPRVCPWVCPWVCRWVPGAAWTGFVRLQGKLGFPQADQTSVTSQRGECVLRKA